MWVVVAVGDDNGGESFVLVTLVDGDDAVVLLDGGGAALAGLAAAPAAAVVAHLKLQHKIQFKTKILKNQKIDSEWATSRTNHKWICATEFVY